MAEVLYEYAGYVFSSSAEMELAKKEAAGIQHINSKINYDDATSLLAIYNKLLERDLFTTVVGIDFLRNIRKILMEEYDYSSAELKSVPVHLTGISKEELKVNEQIKKTVKKSDNQKKEKPKKVINISMLKPLIVVVAIAAILVVIVFIQFRVYSDSENLNILNYKARLERQYESWEEDLTERERVLNEKNLLK